jgi:hypothetical protein
LASALQKLGTREADTSHLREAIPLYDEILKERTRSAAVVPGVERQPLKRLDADKEALLKLLQRWRNEASQAGHEIKRIVIAYEAGRDGFWLARWLLGRDCEASIVQPYAFALGWPGGLRARWALCRIHRLQDA